MRISIPIFIMVCLAVFWGGCSSTSVVTSSDGNLLHDPQYTAIIYIHGDSDYLYHNQYGDVLQADVEALKMAKNVAKKGVSGEYYIFHRNPRKQFFGLFPRRNSHFYHIKKGEIIHHTRFRYNRDYDRFLKTEAGLFHTHAKSSENKATPLHFIYFGHEIPIAPVGGYHRSAPEFPVYTEPFANALEQFLIEDESRFSLVVLSTCSNGTPAMAAHLAPFTDYLVASPTDLHLSYFDISGLLEYENDPDTPISDIARRIAEQSYQELSKRVHTAVSAGVYNLDETRHFIDRFAAKTDLHRQQHQPNPFRENRDCALIDDLFEEEFLSGVEVFYRPPAFGANSRVTSISGWGCKADP